MKAYYWVCPVCGKQIFSFYPEEVMFNATQHLRRHKMKAKVLRKDLIEVEVEERGLGKS